MLQSSVRLPKGSPEVFAWDPMGRLVLKSACGNAPERLKRLDVRFSSPVYPGETPEADIWRIGEAGAAFRARVVERDVVVLQNGYVEFGD